MPFLRPEPSFDTGRMKKVAVFDAPGAAVELYCLLPGQAQHVHRHDDVDKFYYVIGGRARFTLGEETRELGPGEAVGAPRGVAHGVENASAEPLVALVTVAPRPSHA